MVDFILIDRTKKIGVCDNSMSVVFHYMANFTSFDNYRYICALNIQTILL